MTVGTRYSNRPTTAAARAGTTTSAYAVGVSGAIGAIRMPAAPATAPLRHQLGENQAKVESYFYFVCTRNQRGEEVCTCTRQALMLRRAAR